MSVLYSSDEKRLAIGAADAGKEKSVLIIDESKTARKIVTDLVAQAGFQTCSLGDTPDLAQIVESLRPILIILANGMPSADATTVIGQLCRNNDTCSIPIIVTLTKDALPQARHLLAAGAVDCICKPLCPDEFIARVQVAVRNSRAFEQRQREFAQLAKCLTENSFEPMIVCDGEGSIEAWSAAAGDFFGNLPNLASGLNISSFIPQLQTILDVADSAKGGPNVPLTKTSSLVFEATRNDGSKMLLSIARITFHGLQRIVVFAQNKLEANTGVSHRIAAALHDADTRGRELVRLVKSELQLPLRKIANLTLDETKGRASADRQSIIETIRICMVTFRNLLEAVDMNLPQDLPELPQVSGIRFDAGAPNGGNKPHITEAKFQSEKQKV